MPYSSKISSKHPMAVVIMVDQSGSMSEHITWNGIQMTKATALSEVINNMLTELASRSRSESSYRHYYDIMVVGYSGTNVASLLDTRDSYFLTPAQLMGSVRRMQPIQRQRRLPDGRLVMTSLMQRIWVEITAEGRTPMRAAFNTVFKQLRLWCASHADSFPPIVINITDGEATDGSAEQLAEAVDQIRSLSTNDGNPLIMNVHLSGTSDKSVLFPCSKAELPSDRYAELLFDLSSRMPPIFCREVALQYDHEAQREYCAMAYNASMTDVVRLLNIGSTTISHNVAL